MWCGLAWACAFRVFSEDSVKRGKSCMHTIPKHVTVMEKPFILTFTTLWANLADKLMMFFFLFFPRKQDLTFQTNCLQWRQYAWYVETCFLVKVRKIFQNVARWKFYAECYALIILEKINICNLIQCIWVRLNQDIKITFDRPHFTFSYVNAASISKCATLWDNIPPNICASRRFRPDCADKSSLSVWRKIGSLPVQKAPSKYSDQTVQMSRSTNLRYAYRNPQIHFHTSRPRRFECNLSIRKSILILYNSVQA